MVRILVVSDLHANGGALRLIDDERADAIVFLGDAVDYGPDPQVAVSWVLGQATHAVRGNHDEAVATGAPTRASAALADVAEETAAWTRATLEEGARAALGRLPLTARFELGGAHFLALHAAPSDPLYRYLPPETDDATWEQELAEVEADWLLFGHTHRRFLRRFGRRSVLNPGSLGQPRDRVPFASYAIWDDGDVFFAARRYDVEGVTSRLARMRLDASGHARLARVLRTGEL